MATRDTLSKQDWVALRAAGVQVEGSKPPRLDRTAMASRFVNYLVDHATVDSDADFSANGVTLGVFVHRVLGLPEDAKIESIEQVEGWVKDALKGTSLGRVQEQIGDQGWLVKGSFDRTLVDITSGVSETKRSPMWAITSNPDLVLKYAVIPSHGRVLSFAFGSLRDQVEQVRRIPHLAPQVIALEQQRAAVVQAGTQHAYDRITSGMTDEERTALDAQVTVLREQYDREIAVETRLAIEALASA